MSTNKKQLEDIYTVNEAYFYRCLAYQLQRHNYDSGMLLQFVLDFIYTYINHVTIDTYTASADIIIITKFCEEFKLGKVMITNCMVYVKTDGG